MVKRGYKHRKDTFGNGKEVIDANKNVRAVKLPALRSSPELMDGDSALELKKRSSPEYANSPYFKGFSALEHNFKRAMGNWANEKFYGDKQVEHLRHNIVYPWSGAKEEERLFPTRSDLLEVLDFEINRAREDYNQLGSNVSRQRRVDAYREIGKLKDERKFIAENYNAIYDFHFSAPKPLTRHSPAGVAASVLSIAGILGGLAMLSPNLTGNAIGTLTTETASWIGAVLIVIGIIALYFLMKAKKKKQEQFIPVKKISKKKKR